ncbi:GapR family DNA-binding domain-containing protein [Allomesorhizobium alhagi]
MFTEKETGEETYQTVAAGQLRAFIERVERLEEEKATIAEDIREIFQELKGTGFDVKAVRTIIKLRKKDQAERQEEEAILDLYMAALGMA